MVLVEPKAPDADGSDFEKRDDDSEAEKPDDEKPDDDSDFEKPDDDFEDDSDSEKPDDDSEDEEVAPGAARSSRAGDDTSRGLPSYAFPVAVAAVLVLTAVVYLLTR